jgi:hypothetical protein
MNPHMLFYRQILCGALGGLDNYDERSMVRFLILRIDALDEAPAPTNFLTRPLTWCRNLGQRFALRIGALGGIK